MKSAPDGRRRCPAPPRQDTIAARGGKGAPFPTGPTVRGGTHNRGSALRADVRRPAVGGAVHRPTPRPPAAEAGPSLVGGGPVRAGRRGPAAARLPAGRPVGRPGRR